VQLSRLGAGLLLSLLVLPSSLLAAQRGQRELRPLIEDPLFLPSANAPAALSQNILSGLDYTCIAPPDSRLRVIEDEPYIYTTGLRCKERLPVTWAHSAITIRSDLAAGGWYEAVVSLLWQPRRDNLEVLRAFDTAAHEAYERSALARETRDGTTYGLYEVRSPLGIVEPLKKGDALREFLAYSAAVSNPLLSNPLASSTPYDYSSGKLMLVPALRASTVLVSVEFDAKAYPHALPLSENLARCVVNRLYEDEHSRLSVSILDYAPEYEIAMPQTDSAGRLVPLDPRTADLAEQPAEGCGPEGLPAGGLLPVCPEPPRHWPARPYGQFTDELDCACEDACSELAATQPRTEPSLTAAASGWALATAEPGSGSLETQAPEALNAEADPNGASASGWADSADHTAAASSQAATSNS